MNVSSVVLNHNLKFTIPGKNCKKRLHIVTIFMFSLLKVGNLFGSHRSTIITLYNGAFDSSSALFFVIKVTDAHMQLTVN